MKKFFSILWYMFWGGYTMYFLVQAFKESETLVEFILGLLGGVLALALLIGILISPFLVVAWLWNTSVKIRAQHNLETELEEKRLTQ